MPAGLNRSAALGTFRTLAFSAVTSLTLAVMPGTSLPEGFATATTTVYVTTFWTTCAALRICVTVPVNVSPGNASTVKVARSSSLMRPMSASSTLVSTCICVRSWAIVKSTGACRLAATVWPTSTWRETTTPSTGARIVVWSRSTCACLSAASFCLTWARADSRDASTTRSWAIDDWMADESACSRARVESSWATAAS